MRKTENIHVKVDAELKKKVQAAAAKDGRTISNWILYLIDKELKK